MAKSNDEQTAMESFLSARLAEVLNIDLASIDVEKRFSAYGLDSLDAVTLVFELEELVKRELPSTLLWDNPSIRACCSFIVEQTRGKEVGSQI
jgi:acyl carrier protein